MYLSTILFVFSFTYFRVYVPGEHPAAMQHGGQLRLEYPLSACLLSVLLVVLVGP